MEKRLEKRVGCATIVRNGDRIALVKRGKQPNYGLWVIPGGGLKPTDASLRDCARREIREEIGIEIRLGEPIGIYKLKDSVNAREIHYYWADYGSGELRAGDDALEARWCTREEVQSMIRASLITPFVVKVLTDVGWGL